MREVIDWRTCERCGRRFRTTPQKRWDYRHGLRPLRFCGHACHRASQRAHRIYADTHERDREQKRRQRAKLHALGLTAAGKKPTAGGEYEASKRLWVAPTGGSRR